MSASGSAREAVGVAYQLATPFTVLLAWPLLAERPSLTTSAGVLLAFVGVIVLAAEPGLSSKRASAAACGRIGLCIRGIQRPDQTLRPV